MKKFKFLIILHFVIFFLISCNDNNNVKGKKGDFSFRKCTSCKVLDD